MSEPAQSLLTTCEVGDWEDSFWVSLLHDWTPPAAATASAAPLAAGASGRGPPTADRRRRTPDSGRAGPGGPSGGASPACSGSSWAASPPWAAAATGAPQSSPAASAQSPPAASAEPAAPPAAAGTSSLGQPTAYLPLIARELRRPSDIARSEDFPRHLKRVLQSPPEECPLLKRVLYARLTTDHWKKFVWLLRAKQAAQQEGEPLRRRPVRWLATLLAREVGLI